MSYATKFKLIKSNRVSPEIADVLEEAGILTPKDIKLADDSDLEAAGLTPEEIKKVRERCPAYKQSKD